jgi:hypothetical protein
MPLRKLLIHVMLWSLAATAVMGAYNALIGANTTGWRLVGTGVAAAIAAAAMIPFAARAAKPQSRVDGLAGMAVTIAVFVMIVGLIFDVFAPLGDYQVQDKIWGAFWILTIGGYCAVGMLRLIATPGNRLAGAVGMGVVPISVIVSLVGLIEGRNGNPDIRLFGSGMSIAGLGFLATLALAGMEKPRPWRWVGVLAAFAALVMAIVGLWSTQKHDAGPFAVIIAIAVIVAHANLCLLVPTAPSHRWIPIPTIAAAMVTALFTVLTIFAGDRHEEFVMAERMSLAGGILTAAGTLAMLVLARLNKQLERKQELSDIKQLTLICPGCETKQTVDVGDSACIACGLKFSIKVEEPRCPQCDYLLYKLQSDRCPECGFELKIPGSGTRTEVQPA